jgi:hypothetical protein
MPRLRCDRWEGVHDFPEEKSEPSVDDLRRALEALDQHVRTMVSIEHADGKYLAVGGGKGSYVVHVSVGAGRVGETFWNLIGLRRAEPCSSRSAARRVTTRRSSSCRSSPRSRRRRTICRRRNATLG